MAQERKHSAAWFVFVTAVVMSLGWGLRGYIGGGPLGAMIPGAFVALLLCQMLGYSPELTAVAAAFGAIGVGFGGEMTYGQTIGLATDSATRAWGMTGLALKGGIWGLLGGAVMGMGLAWDRMDRRRLPVALACFLAATVIGIGLINEPKLIYFSNRLDRPRDESWAGLLFGALALLAYLSLRQKQVAPVARRFALYGLAGGTIGFGGGGLFMAYGPHVEGLQWLPWWKFMEFTFGFCFGAALGLCAYHLRGTLQRTPVGENASPRPAAFVGPAALVAAALILWPLVGFAVGEAFGGHRVPVVSTMARVLFGYTGLGCLLMVLAARSESVAWHVAITITFVATVIDLVGDLGPEGDIPVNAALRWGFVAVMAVLAVVYVVLWQRRTPRSLTQLTLVFLWALTGVAMVKPFISKAMLFPEPNAIADAGGFAPYLFGRFEGQFIVHGLFLALAIASTWAIARNANSESEA